MKKLLKVTDLKNIYFTLIYPHINFISELYAFAPLKYLNKLIVLINKLLRIVQSKSRFISNNKLYKCVNILPLKQLGEFNLLLLVHKWFFNKASLPKHFHTLFIK